MLRNTPLAWSQRRNLRLSRCFWFFRFLSCNRCNICFDLLDEGIPGKRIRIDNLSIDNAILSQLFTDLVGVNLIQ